MPVVDLATLAFEIDGGRAEQGARRVNAALDAIERKVAAALQAVARFGQGLGSVGGSGVGGALSKVEQAAIRHQQKLEQIAARRESATQRHEQRLIEIEASAAARREGRRNQELTSLQAFLRRYSSTIREAGESIQQAGALFSGFAASFFNFGRTAIEASGRVESLKRGLQVFDGGQAPQTFERLKAQADALKTSFADYAQSVIRVRSTQKLTADESERLVRGLINISRQIGATAEQQGRAVTALNQILSKNKVQAEELRGQLFEAIPNLAPIVEKRFDTLQAEELEKRFGAKKFVQGLIEELGKVNQVEPTGLERFQASLENLALKFAPVGEKILELLNTAMEPLLSVVDSAVKAFSALPDPLKKAAIAAGLLSLALGPLVNLTGGILQTAGAIGNLVTVLAQARAAGGVASIFGAAGPTGIIGALTSINPLVLALTGAVIGGAIAWAEYSRRIDDAIALAARTKKEFLPGVEQPPTIVGGKNGGLRGAQITPVGDVGFAPPAPPTPITKKDAQSLVNQRLEQFARDSQGNFERAQAKLELIRKTDTKLDEAIRFLEAERKLRQTLTGGGGKEKPTTIFGRLSEELTEVNKQIAILRALPALFSNPITAIIGGAIIGSLALSKLFGGGTFKKFQDVVELTYQVKVKGDQPGKQLFQQVESLGKAAFGSFSKNIQRTVQLDEARNLIGQYTEVTNQEGSALVKRMRQIREIGELGNPLNQFVRREFGGAFFAGQSVIAGERRQATSSRPSSIISARLSLSSSGRRRPLLAAVTSRWPR